MSLEANESNKLQLIKLKVLNKAELELKPRSEYTEAEKMISSIPFDIRDQTLLNGQAFAKTLLRKINTSDPLDNEGRHEMFSQLLGKTIYLHFNLPHKKLHAYKYI